MTIYLDVIWLLNVCFDGLLLWLTAIILKREVRWWRLTAGAFIGSLIVLLLFTPFSPYVQQPLMKLFFSILIVLASFGFKRFRYFFENLFTFYLATFMVGGGLIAVHYLLQTDIVISGMLTTYSLGTGDPVSWLFVLIGFPTLWIFSKKRMNAVREKKLRFEHIVNVVLTFREMSFSLKGLIDSGNQLYDPLTKTPVMIVNASAVKGMLPTELLARMNELNDFTWLDDERWKEWATRLRLIPYRGIGQTQRFLWAIQPDRVTIYYESQWIEVTKGLVGLNEADLSTDGEYQCIVHPKMIQTGKRLTAS